MHGCVCLHLSMFMFVYVCLLRVKNHVNFTIVSVLKERREEDVLTSHWPEFRKSTREDASRWGSAPRWATVSFTSSGL